MRIANRTIPALRPVRIVPSIVLVSLTVGCAEPIKPFRAPVKSTLASTSVPASPRAALHVRKIRNLPEPDSSILLSEYLALALQDQGFTASLSGGFRGSYWLDGQVLMPREDGPVMMVRGRWRLFHPDGRLFFEAASSTRLTVADFFLNKAIGYRRIARDAARAVDSRLYLFEGGSARRPQLPSVSVGAITGAPGDGNRHLTTAIIAALVQAGVPVSAGAPADGYELHAVVAPAAAADGRARVRIVWTVIRPDQTEIGRFVQLEELPAKPSAQSWGPLAGRIATRARVEIVDLLQSLAGIGSN